MKVRVISAIVALLICIPIIVIGDLPFYIGASIIGLIGFIELLNAKEKKKKIPYIMKILSVISFLFIMINNWDILGGYFALDYSRITAVLFMLILPIIFFYKSKKYDSEDALFLLGGVMFLGVGFNELVNVRINGLNNFIFLLLITIFTDTFALFVGKLIGRHKMCPSVSPNKTWEGFFGGLGFSTFICTVLYIAIFDYTGNIFTLILIVALLSVVGQLGDLVFSAIKRHFGIKDYGNIMPGHGGVLDRVDSLLFVILAFSFVARFL